MNMPSPPPGLRRSRLWNWIRAIGIGVLVGTALAGVRNLWVTRHNLTLAASSHAREMLPPVSAFVDTPEHDEALQRFVNSALLFTLLHEMGHMMVQELAVKSAGLPENEADRFAAYMLTTGPRGATKPNPLADAAEFLFALHLESQAEHPGEYDWADLHGPNIQRAYLAACLLYGASPQSWDTLAQKLRLDMQHRQDCIRDARDNQVFWRDTLAAAVHGEANTSSPTVAVIYRPIGNGASREVIDMLSGARKFLQGAQSLELIAGNIKELKPTAWVLTRQQTTTDPGVVGDRVIDADAFLKGRSRHIGIQHPDSSLADLDPYDYTVIGDACLNDKGVPIINAYWDPAARSIFVCYQLVNKIAQIGMQVLAKADQMNRTEGTVK